MHDDKSGRGFPSPLGDHILPVNRAPDRGFTTATDDQSRAAMIVLPVRSKIKGFSLVVTLTGGA